VTRASRRRSTLVQLKGLAAAPRVAEMANPSLYAGSARRNVSAVRAKAEASG
jgi:hypothetical protein